MTEMLGTEVAQIGIRLLDDAYMVWFAAEGECEQALRAWLDATWRSRTDAYFAYRAALDREEAAARDLQRLGELAQPCRDILARNERASSNLAVVHPSIGFGHKRPRA